MSPKLVVDMRDKRPVWAMPDWALDEIRAALPPGWTLHEVETLADGSGDGMTGPSPQALAAVEDADVYLGFGVPPEILLTGLGLRWVHSGAAGVGSSLTPAMKRWDGVFTNSAGVHGPPMAETVLAMILHFARGLDFAVRAQARRRWSQDAFYEADSPVTELAEATVGILGYGGVGRDVAGRLAPLGPRIVALRRHEERGSDPETGAELLGGPAGLERLQAESDYLVVTLPETDETRGLVDAGFLSRMKTGAVLVNVSRGRIVDENALVSALASGGLRGAALDVVRKEPLSPESPLWDLPNVLITPHVSAVSRSYWRREVDLIVENLGRFLAGRELLNVVDPEAGY